MHKLSTAGVTLMLAFGATLVSQQANASQPTPIPQSGCFAHGASDWSGFYAGAQAGAAMRDEFDAFSAPADPPEKHRTTEPQDALVTSGTPLDVVDTISIMPMPDKPQVATVSLEQDDRFAHAGIHVGYNRQCGRLLFGIEGDLNRFNEHFDHIATLRGRVGLVHGRALFYLTGGIAFAKFSDDSIDGTFAIPPKVPPPMHMMHGP